MRQLNGVYTQKFNRAHSRVGHVFQGRYKAIFVNKNNYLLEVALYSVKPCASTNGPFHSRLAFSYRATAGLVVTPPQNGWIFTGCLLHLIVKKAKPLMRINYLLQMAKVNLCPGNN